MLFWSVRLFQSQRICGMIQITTHTHFNVLKWCRAYISWFRSQTRRNMRGSSTSLHLEERICTKCWDLQARSLFTESELRDASASVCSVRESKNQTANKKTDHHSCYHCTKCNIMLKYCIKERCIECFLGEQNRPILYRNWRRKSIFPSLCVKWLICDTISWCESFDLVKKTKLVICTIYVL